MKKIFVTTTLLLFTLNVFAYSHPGYAYNSSFWKVPSLTGLNSPECRAFQDRQGLKYIINMGDPYTGPYNCERDDLGSNSRKRNLFGQGNYVDGLKHGVWIEYRVRQSVCITNRQNSANFDSQEPVLARDHYRLKGSYINGTKEGKWEEYLNTVMNIYRIDCIVNFSEGQPDGSFVRWYENGQKEVAGIYIGGKKEGLWRYWYESGQKQKERNYSKDLRNGTSTGWDENGQIRITGSFVDGKRHGKLTKWASRGNKTSEASYRNDVLHGNSFQFLGCCVPIQDAPKAIVKVKVHYKGLFYYTLELIRIRESKDNLFQVLLITMSKEGLPQSLYMLDFAPHYYEHPDNNGTIFELPNLEAALYNDDLSWKWTWVIPFVNSLNKSVSEEWGKMRRVK